MSKIEVDEITQQSGSTLTVGGGACKTATVDATTVTLGRSGGTVSLASGATQSGFGRTGTVDWDTTPKTATFSAVSGDGFFCNTTSSAFTCNLPAGSAGAIVSLADYAATWDSNNLTVSPNGSEKIGGVNGNVTLNTQGQSVTFVYVDSTQGWVNVQDSTSNERATTFISATGGTITTCGNFKIHTFTSPGTFCISSVSNVTTNNLVSYLVVAGGGGGGGNRGGGGGAGGFREIKSPTAGCYTASPLDGYPSAPNRVTVTATAFPITVGAGGSGTSSDPSNAASGSNSVFSTITSAGGGLGGSKNAPSQAGGNGGSGGGGQGADGTGSSGGLGNTPPVSPAQGKHGGTGDGSSNGSGAGGGGATAEGANGSFPNGGPGGAGATTSINGTPTAYAGGGGGAGWTGVGGCGGSGGGGNGVRTTPNVTSNPGTANTGGGGGGGPTTPGGTGNGGSGIVIIRYKYQ